MAQVTVFTSDRMQQIEANTITGADVIDGNLILHRYDGSTIDAGPVNANAVLSSEGAWDNGTVYNVNALVTHSGSSWICNETTTAGDEPGVSGKWDEFIISNATPDVTTGDHDIDGTLTFTTASPTIPAAAADTEAASLGDVKSEIADAPALVDSPGGAITFVDNLGDIQAKLDAYHITAHDPMAVGITSAINNTTAETQVWSTDTIPADTFVTETQYGVRTNSFFGGKIWNNSGGDVTYTFRGYVEILTGAGAGTNKLFEVAHVIPTNSPAGTEIRTYRCDFYALGFHFLAVPDIGNFGQFVSRVSGQAAIGVGTAIDEELMGWLLEANPTYNCDEDMRFYATVEMDVASASAQYSGFIGNFMRWPYVAE